MAAITAENLSLQYHAHCAFRDVSLAIAPQAVTVLVGPSGCGKTSFLACMNRLTDLLPGCRVAGSLQVDGVDILAPGADVHALRRRVGMIFQQPNPFPCSIRRNLYLPLREHRFCRRREEPEHIEQVLRRVGLWDEVRDRLDAKATDLSGGQQQRLCIARALILQPHILLFDEPCSALDPIAAGIIEDLIDSLRAEVTTVVVTHDLAQARRLADYLAVFWRHENAGVLVEHGPAGDCFAAPRSDIAAAYLVGRRPDRF